jgi:alpha-tubulin suppressor-like RCC1 family protein
LSFRQVSAGGFHSCGLTSDNRAYCWGHNEPSTYADGSGELGDGTTISRLTPVAVFGGLHFRVVSAGTQHTCGVTTDSLAYCWGLNTFGSLGEWNEHHSSDPGPG